MTEINYLNLPAIYGAAANIQSAKINSRLDAMKMAEYEKELAKKENRNALAKNYFSGGSPEQNLQPQMTQAPAQSFTGNALAAPEYSAQPNVNIPATAPKQDYTGYANALMGSGDVEGGMAVMKSADEQKKHALDVTKATVDIANGIGQMEERQRTASLKNLELIGNAAAGVLSEYEKLVNSGMPDGMARQQIQPLYEQTRNSLENAGVKIQNASPVFNPDEARSAVSLVLGVKDRISIVNQPKTVKGFDKNGRPVIEDKQGNLTYQDGSPYKGSSLKPVTEAPSSNVFIGVNPDTGAVQTMNSKGAPKVTEIKGPEGGVGPKNKQRLDPGDTKIITDSRNLMDDLDWIANTVQKHPEYVGPIQGRTNELALKVANDPEFAAFQNKTAGLIRIVYSLSGKTVTDRERDFFENKLLPSLKQPSQNFISNAKSAKDMLSRGTGSYTDALKKQGYIVSDIGASTPSTPKIGEVLHGYKFKGGDPSSPNSWEQVR